MADQPQPRSIDERLDILAAAVSDVSADGKLLHVSISNLRDLAGELYVDMREVKSSLIRLDGIAEQNGLLMTQLLDTTHKLAVKSIEHETRITRLEG